MKQAVTPKLIKKLALSFLAILLLVGGTYILITIYFANKFFEETTQKLNAHIASHLINEKFKDASPFLPDGQVNKPLFGDLMHDMMAVNSGIEVYLLNQTGEVLYSVVLDHDKPDAPLTRLDLDPIKEFIASQGTKRILGDDPRNPGIRKIFSAAPYSVNGHDGYIYIILASRVYEEVTSSLLGSYFLRLGLGASIVTIGFAVGLGILSIWFLTKNLREVIFQVTRFKEGDLNARVEKAHQSDLSVLAETFNDMADTLVDNIEKLKSVENLRRELVANISHDLRTPLAITQGYAETLLMKNEDLSPEERNKYLKIIFNNTEKLSHLVAQLFEYSKLEANQVEPQKEPFNISELAQDIYVKYQMLAEKKGIQIKLQSEPDTPLVFADISLVERAIQNLMDNALKFTPENGSVTIQIEPSPKQVKVTIKDTGIGIPLEEQSKIFERYHRGGSQKKDALVGAGLGLAIVKKILEIHDSTIRVISQPNQGTSFQFQLPVHQVV